MNKKMQTKKVVLAALALFVVVGCENKPSVDEPTIGANAPFDYKIEATKDLRIDYGFAQNDYTVLFELYEESPLAQDKDGQTYKKNIEPFYRAATNGSGKFEGQITLLSSLTSVWLYSEFAGTLSPVQVPVVGNAIEFDQKKYLASNALSKSSHTRAATGSGKKYPDNWLVLGDWDEYGTPLYLEDDRRLPASSLLYNINEIFVKYNSKPLKDRHSDFFKKEYSANIHITKKTKVYLTFVNSTAGWNNVVGYYHYPTNGPEPQTSAEVQRIMAYPAATPYVKSVAGQVSRGALVAGSRVLLRYWDGKEFHDEFPAGETIGWWLEGMGFNADASITEKNFNGPLTRYSLDHLNADSERRAVSLLDPKSGRIVSVGFEDNMDLRYNDATFYLETELSDAIKPTLPVIPDGGAPEDKDNYYKKNGVLLFEDLWPSTGDYDMNDVMVRYSSTVYKHILSNRVYKIVDEYTALHSGGSLTSGFGYQYSNLQNNELYHIKVEGDVASKFMEGQQVEPGQEKPTVILFDNTRLAKNKKIVVTAEFHDALETALVPPYNPFIIVGTDKHRTKEVHLVQYPPTSKIDPLLFGTMNDGSDPSKGIYYVNKNDTKFPFALNIPLVETMPIFEEGVRIDTGYPKFKSWVDSNGKKDADWFRYPAK